MVTLQTSGERTRAQVAELLRELADEIDEEAPVGATATDVRTRIAAADERNGGTPTVTAVAGSGRDDEQSGTNAVEASTGDDETEDRHHSSEPGEPGVDTDPRIERITFISGGDSATVSLPPALDVDLTVKSHSPMFRSGTHQRVRIDLSWNILAPEDHHDDGIRIE